jgi:hypothetical protein
MSKQGAPILVSGEICRILITVYVMHMLQAARLLSFGRVEKVMDKRFLLLDECKTRSNTENTAEGEEEEGKHASRHKKIIKCVRSHYILHSAEQWAKTFE